MKASRILEILHSVGDISINNSGVDVDFIFTTNEAFFKFRKDPFAKDLFELIEKHVLTGRAKPCLDSMSEDEAPPRL